MTNYVDVLTKLASFKPKTMRGKRITSAAGVLSVAVLLSFSLFATAPDPVPEELTEKAWPISSISIKPEQLAPAFSAYGKVESNNIAVIQSDSMETIARVNVREGQYVSEGEVLVELNKHELGLRIRESKAELDLHRANLSSIQTDFDLAKETRSHYKSVYELSQKKLARHQELLETRMISQSLLDEAVQQASARTIEYQDHRRQMADFPNRILEQNARVSKAESALEQAEINLEKATIKAPFDGPVLSVMASPGSHAIPGEALLTMAQTAGFEVRVALPNAYVERLRAYLINTQPVYGTISDSQTEFKMSLTRLSSNVKTGQSGVDAFFKIDAVNLKYLPEIGRIVDVLIVLPAEKNVVALPLQSLYENDRIYEVLDDRLKAIVVTRVGEYKDQDGKHRILVRWENQQSGQEIISTQLPKPITGLLIKRVAT